MSLISSEAFVLLPDAAAGSRLHVNKTRSVSPVSRVAGVYRFFCFVFVLTLMVKSRGFCPLWVFVFFFGKGGHAGERRPDRRIYKRLRFLGVRGGGVGWRWVMVGGGC